MKKLIFLLLMFLAQGSNVTAQGFCWVSGTVTELTSGAPIPNHPVTIVSDSTNSGFIYYQTVYTNSNGFYVDTIPYTTGTSGVLYVYTYDCNNVQQLATLYYSPTNLTFTQNFQICYNNSPCQADFTYGYSAPLTLQFTDQSTGTTGPWNWQFGDGAWSNLQNPSHTFPQTGYYYVTLSIGDSSAGCWDFTTQTVYVGDSTGGNCLAHFTYSQDPNGGSNTVQFTDQSTGNISSWSWDFGDGQYSTLQNPVHTYAQGGAYNVCLTIQGVDSLCYDTYCEVIQVGNSTGGCQAQFTYYPDSAWTTNIIHFMDLSTGNITSWFWNFGDSAFSTEQNPSHEFPRPGIYYVCLTIQGFYSGGLCESTWCEEVVVGNGSDCISYFTYLNNGLSVTFSGYMVNGQQAAYYWDFGDGATSQGQTVVHQYPVTGIYYVTLTTATQDSISCTYSSGQSITVGDSTQWNQIYGQVFAGNFPLETGMVMIFSLDTNLNYLPFIDISLVDSSGIYYFRMVPQGNYLIYAIPFLPTGYLPTYYGDVIFWEDATIVTLGQANNPYNINLVTANYFIPGIGSINGQINTGGLKTILVDKITMLLMDEQGQAISYNQVNEEGQFDFSGLDYGIYYLHAELAGCNSDYIKVEITPGNPVVEVVLTFSGNNILGIGDPKPVLEAGVVYPNPVSNQAQISVTLPEAALVTIELFNLTGQAAWRNIQHLEAGTSTLQIAVSQIPEGMYTLRISTDSGLTLTRKLLKSR
ncbi:MAG: PKD domain-containing protein [bacterium]